MSIVSKGRSRLIVILVALVIGLATTFGSAAPSQAAGTGKVHIEILQYDHSVPHVNMAWFAADWTFLGKRKVSGGIVSMSFEPGTYYLQFTDLRASYDVTKSAPATIKVTVRTASSTGKTVRMRRGASIGGVVKAGGKPGAGARIVAANTDQQSFESTANRQGQYALGGLPPGNYSVFTYDKSGTWVAKSTYLRGLKGPAYKNVDIALTKRGGTLSVDLYAGTSDYPGTAYVTAVSRASGQFWTAKASHGSVTFAGLYPGSYVLQVPGVGNYLGATVRVAAKVVSGRTKFSSARLTKRGGWVTGVVVDQNDPSQTLAGATVRLVAADGHQLDVTTSDSTGAFTLDGPLTTQQDATVIAGPGPYSDYLGKGTSYCKYRTGRTSGVAIRTGERTDVATLALPHLPDAEQDGQQCWTPAPRTPLTAS